MDRIEIRRRYRIKHRERIRKENREWQRQWRKDNPELAKQLDLKRTKKYNKQRNAYSKSYYLKHKNDERYKKLRNERTLRYYYRNKVKALARNAVNKAIRDGLMSKNDFCCICGSDKYIQAHHKDYNKPLDVIWVCRDCHYKLENQCLKDIKELLK